MIKKNNYNSFINEVKLKIYSKENNNRNILVISINREEKLNAVNNEILTELINILNKFINDDTIGSIIITGSGNKAFIAGADIELMSKFTPEEAYDYSIKGQNLVKLISSFPKPVFAAINGYALGGGCEIAIACHFRYSSVNAILGQPEVKLGIIAGWGGTQNLSRLIGASNALDLLLSGRNVKSEEALSIGLINGIFEENLIDEVVNIAFKMNDNSPYAISKTIESVKNGYNKDIDKALMIESLLFKDTFSKSESKTGLESFLKKEKPKF